MVSIRSNEHAGVFNDLRALLEYLATGTNLDAAVEVYDAFIGELARRSLTGPDSPVHEICLLRKSRLLYLHSTTAKPFKPATLRLCLETSLSVFPQNSAFLSLFTWNEARTKIENRVRTVIRDRVLAEGGETVIGWLFAIWAELRMGVHFNVHAVRSLFERAVECSRTKSSPALWALFVEFEMRQRDGNRARNTLMRGIRNCPWSKGTLEIRMIWGIC